MPDDEFLTDLQWPSDPLRAPRSDRPSERARDDVPGSGDAAEDAQASSPSVDPFTVVNPGTVDVAAVARGDSGRISRFVVDAFDRLAERVLERLRALREDVDADLAGVRSELASLRQAVDDVGDRVQLRQLRASIDALRGDVSSLRRAVLEWPELEQVSTDLAGLRADVSELLGRPISPGPAASEPRELELVRAELGEITRLLQASSGLSGLAPLIEEVSGLREDVSSLRRRISLRASAEPSEPTAGVGEARGHGREGRGRRPRAK